MIFTVTVTKNEADRYLQRMFAQLDGLTSFVYDDQSDDNTVEVCEKAGATVAVRPGGAPSFLEHEGAFRQAAWEEFEQACSPAPGDWVLAIDADELAVAGRPVADEASALIGFAQAGGRNGVNVAIPEVWGWELEDPDVANSGAAASVTWAPRPLIRTDGFWGNLSAPRLFAYQSGGHFTAVAMGCGSTPRYVQPPFVDAAGPAETAGTLALLHVGYADHGDRVLKYNRYHNRSGHNPAHIASILGPAVTRPWRGPLPRERRPT